MGKLKYLLIIFICSSHFLFAQDCNFENAREMFLENEKSFKEPYFDYQCNSW